MSPVALTPALNRLITRSDLPSEFIRAFNPIAAHRHERGLARYLMDPYGLAFFRSMANEPVTDDVIWSVLVMPRGESLRLVAGQDEAAIGRVVSEVSSVKSPELSYELPRLLTTRQKMRQTVLKELATALTQAGLPNTDEVMTLLGKGPF